MGVDIASVVRAQKLASLKRSIASSETHEQRVANSATRVQVMLSNGTAGVPSEHLEEYLMRDTYHRMMEEYTRKPQHGVAPPEFTPRALAAWRRVVKACKESGVDRDTFIRAQFTWFHEKFRTPPTLPQLTTDAAVIRAASVAPKQVRTNNIEAEISVGDLFKRCEKQMADLMRAQKLTREEVYLTLVKPGLVMFPDKFLNADPTWRKVKNG